MSVIIRVTDTPVEHQIRRNVFVLHVMSTSGRYYPDTSEHEFDHASNPLVNEAIQILSIVENEFDGVLEEDHWDELVADYSKEAVQLVYDLIGGDITTDCGTMASLDGYEVTWFDDQGVEYETELEIE